jgi:hypothetical protein
MAPLVQHRLSMTSMAAGALLMTALLLLLPLSTAVQPGMELFSFDQGTWASQDLMMDSAGLTYLAKVRGLQGLLVLGGLSATGDSTNVTVIHGAHPGCAERGPGQSG